MEEFRESCRNRRRRGRDSFLLVPLGGLAKEHPALLGTVREYLEGYYGVRTEVAPALEMPEAARDPARGQWDAGRIVPFLRDRHPEETLATIGFCREDLYSGSLNFVFGVAEPWQRAGVYSLSRYGGAGDSRFLERALKVATHEVGHMLGMEHCVRRACNMNGANSVPEMDRTPLRLCPECLEKARFSTGLDPGKRYETLSAFYGRNGFEAEASFARRRAGR